MPAITKKEELTENFLSNLKRKDLLNLCKDHGIKCVGKNSELIEKLLEHQKSSVLLLETPQSNNFNEKIISTPMTPQKHFHLPIVETPNTSALIKSIVQSAKKTGLNSSPVRVPFALSPMALKFGDTKLNFSPMKAKEPSQVIKEAFLDHNETGEEISLPFDNKRPHDELENDEEDENDEEQEKEELHLNKREKLELEERGEELHSDLSDKQNNFENDKGPELINEDLDMNEYINNSYELESQSITIPDNLSSLDSLPPLNPSSAPLTTSPSTSTFPPTNFSTDLLRNLKDPEFASPELSSAPDCRVSRSEEQDKFRNGESSVNRSLSKSSSSGSSTKNHPLLPSGIVKLLEKKRQEKEQQHQSAPPTATTTTTTTSIKEGKKKFDLKESLKRPLNYKPHIGFIPKKEKD